MLKDKIIEFYVEIDDFYKIFAKKSASIRRFKCKTILPNK